MNREYTPKFVGPTAKRDSLIYAKYAIADRILGSVVELSESIRFRVLGNPDPIEVIDIESVNFDIYNDINFSIKLFDLLLSINGIGEKTAKKVLAKITTLADLSKATVQDFEDIGIGNARSILLERGIKEYLQRNKDGFSR